MEFIKKAGVIVGGSTITGGAPYSNSISDQDLQYLRENEPYLEQTVSTRGKESDDLADMLKFLLMIPGAQYSSGGVDFAGTYKLIQVMR